MDTAQDDGRLPPAEEWWPLLSIEGKHALRGREGAVPSRVLEEIERITGRSAPAAALSDADRDFIATQREQVD